MQLNCRNSWCRQPFEITQDDLAFLDTLSPVIHAAKHDLPVPSLCPDCRFQRRTAWRNERNLYRRTCSLCRKSMIALYPEGTSFPVYCTGCFFGDAWNPLATGMEFSDREPFFAQMSMLQARAPRIALLSKNSENSEFTNHAADNRNCYLSSIIFNCEDVLYSRKIFRSRSIVDSVFVFGESEWIADCFWVNNVYQATHLIKCFSVRDSHFCFDCKGCDHCFLCSNLRNKSYCFRNEQLTKSAYEKHIAAFLDGKRSSREQAESAFETIMKTKAIHKNLEVTNCEDCSGDYLLDCRRLHDCYYCTTAEDMRHCIECDPSRQSTIGRDSMDVYGFGSSELLYEVQAQADGYGNICNNFSYDVKNCIAVDNCHDSECCFGCIGLRKNSYCILNKQYTKEEYERLVPQIIAHMRKTPLRSFGASEGQAPLRSPDGSYAGQEWGEFFPVTMSPFAYNETVAQEYFPLTKNEVERHGWKWREEKDEIPKVSKVIPASKLPDAIDDVPDDILNWAVECEATKRPFKIIKQELEFYRRMKLPIPRFHPDERHRRRMALRNPRKLWKRACMKCGKQMETTYSPERLEIVYCEECYLKEVY